MTPKKKKKSGRVNLWFRVYGRWIFKRAFLFPNTNFPPKTGALVQGVPQLLIIISCRLDQRAQSIIKPCSN